MPLYAILYAVLAALVVFLSIKLAHYVDLIDKKTDLSGAFIGGVILAAVTSLPELFTSISAVLVVEEPNLVLGNILGSNIFNMTFLGVFLIFFVKRFHNSVIGKSHLTAAVFTLIMFGLMYVAVNLGYDKNFFNISIFSIIIIVIYVLSIRFMAGDDASEGGEDNSSLTLKQITVRFIIMAILLVASSIAITYVTDKLATELNLGATLAGAIFLGVATSLPELTSCYALVKKGNFNACVGNVIGSGVFNFFILAIGGSVYQGESQTKTLVLFGTLCTVLLITTLFLKIRKKEISEKVIPVYQILGVAITACYVMFIALS